MVFDLQSPTLWSDLFFCFSVAYVLTQAHITSPLRDLKWGLGELFKCIGCTGFWVVIAYSGFASKWNFEWVKVAFFAVPFNYLVLLLFEKLEGQE